MSSVMGFERQGYIVLALLPMIALTVWPLLAFPWMVYVGYFVYTQWLRPKFLDPDNKAILVTGCDSGFGQAVALELDMKGCHVFAACLHPDKEGADELRAQASDRLTVLDLDITNEAKVKKAVELMKAYIQENHLRGLWGVYNNAGISMAGECEWTTMDQYRKCVEVNLWGTIQITKAVLPMIRKAKGRVVTISSGIARCVNPGRSAYCISKFGVEAFMDSLRYEMKKFGVKCCTIMPGNLSGSTQIFQGMEKCFNDQMAVLSPDVKRDYGQEYINQFEQSITSGYSSAGVVAIDPVVDDICHALLAASPRVRYKPAQYTWILWWFVYNVFPEDLTDYVWSFQLRNQPSPARIG